MLSVVPPVRDHLCTMTEAESGNGAVGVTSVVASNSTVSEVGKLEFKYVVATLDEW